MREIGWAKRISLAKRHFFYGMPLCLSLAGTPAVESAHLAEVPVPGSKPLRLSFYRSAASQPVRGLIVGCHGRGGNYLHFAKSPAWRSLADAHRFALVGLHFTSGQPDESDPCLAVSRGVEALSAATGIAEIANAPWCTWGFSAGGAIAAFLARRYPERTITFCHHKGKSIQTGLEPQPGAVDQVPGLLSYGELDFSRIEIIQGVFDRNRNAGAPWCLAVDWGRGHVDGGPVEAFAIAWMDTLIPMRLPEAPGMVLRPIPTRLGSLDDPGGAGAMEARAPGETNQAAGMGRTSWLPNASLAARWRALMSRPASSNP
ncbi:MAG: hypothetical protein J0L75_08470 [Spirochaetes bacterium]|nr:hypothetical protein [Spirochaetota bacterium]